MQIVVFGAGKLGLPWGLTLAGMGHEVQFVDPDESLVRAINDRTFQTWEPEVEGLLSRHRLRATVDPSVAQGTDRVDIFVPTPSCQDGRFDPSRVANVFELVTEQISQGKMATSPFPIVIKSTLWPGQTRAIWESCRQCSSDMVRLYYCPELVALGQVIKGMKTPEIQFMGVHSDLFQEDPIVSSTRRRGKRALHVMNWTEAELAKLGLNAMLSAKAAFAFDMARMARALDINPMTVMEAIGDDTRIGRSFLMPGPMPGGPCLPRDTTALVALSDDLGVGATYATDAPQTTRLVEMADIMTRLATAKKVAILGTSYKPGVPCTDDSLGTRIAEALEWQNRDYYIVDFDTGRTDPLEPDDTDAVVLCLLDQRLIDLVNIYFKECPVIIDPWGVL